MNAWVSFISGGLGTRKSAATVPNTGAGKVALFRTPYGTFPMKAGPVNASDGTKASRIVNQDLDRDAFLQLLVLQMQHQNPLEPVENADMLAQLAQFSSLEQMNQLNESFNSLSGNIDQLNFISAVSLLGQRVSGVDMNGQQQSGVVERVHLDGSIVYLTVNGQLMSMAGVMGIDLNDESDPPPADT